MNDLHDRIRSGDIRAIARAISLVENVYPPELPQVPSPFPTTDGFAR
jgi:putative protein kinase ArgK-like GTPase of G3E family